MGVFDKMNFEVKKGVFATNKKTPNRTTTSQLKDHKKVS